MAIADLTLVLLAVFGYVACAPQWQCDLKKYDNTKFYGTLFTMESGVTTAEDCVSLCQQYKSRGDPCSTVNFYARTKRCELMQESIDMNDPKQKQDFAKSYPNCQLIVATNCKNNGQTGSESGSNTGNQAPIPEDKCGQSTVAPKISRSALNGPSKQRIVGGTEARPHSYPWLVSIIKNSGHDCGSSLLRVSNKDETDILLTAAHCVYNLPAGLKVMVGGHNLYDDIKGREFVNVASYVFHEEYNPTHYHHDIALVRLEKPVKFSEFAQPVCLPKPGESIKNDARGIVAGWGAIRENVYNEDGILNELTVPKIADETCVKSYAARYNIIPQYQFCAGYLAGAKDSCQGDSGGPLIFDGQHGFTIRGVVSFGTGCARQNLPGVYINVANYVDWIHQKIKQISVVYRSS